MVEYEYSELFKEDNVSKKLNIDFGEFSIGNADISSQSMEISESLCSEDVLRFGCCEASSFKIRIANNVTPLAGKKFTVSEVLSGGEDTPFVLGSYTVKSDKPTADKKHRDIVAYDAMYDIINADVAKWYNGLAFPITLRQFRDSFFAYFGIQQAPAELANDAMLIEKTIEPDRINGKNVITAICEINGSFGHISRDGKFQYVYLKEMIPGLYPADNLYPSDNLYPADPMNAEQISTSHYTKAVYEDFVTERINKLQIRKEENDIGCIYGSGDNCYVVQDNFLVYGKSADELNVIAENLYSIISRVWYRPAHVEAKGNPCMEVGDGICLRTKYEIVYTYILQRILKGIQALRDTYDAEGEQHQTDKIPSINDQIIELKGKTNKLFRNVEETRSEIANVEKSLSTMISQTAEAIRLEAERAIEEEGKLSASLKITAENIEAEVKRATESEGVLSAQIAVNAQQILLKVSKDNIISEINQTAEKITISAQKIDLIGLVNTQEFVSKYATIADLNVTNGLVADKASIDQLIALNVVVNGKLEVSEFTADNISAMGITVKAANVTGTLSANKISSGNVNGHDVSWQLKPAVYKVDVATAPITYMGADGKQHTTTVVTSCVPASYNFYLLTEAS